MNQNKSALLAQPTSTVRDHIADQLAKDPRRKFRKDVSAFHDHMKALKGEVLPPPPQPEPKQPKKVQEEEKPKRGLGKLVADIRQGEKDKVMEMRANRESRAIERQKAFDEKRAHLVNQNKSALLAQPTSTVRDHIADQLAKDPRRKFRKDVSAFHDHMKALKGEVLPPPPQPEPKQPKKVQEEEKPKRGLGKLVADIRQG